MAARWYHPCPNILTSIFLTRRIMARNIYRMEFFLSLSNLISDILTYTFFFTIEIRTSRLSIMISHSVQLFLFISHCKDRHYEKLFWRCTMQSGTKVLTFFALQLKCLISTKNNAMLLKQKCLNWNKKRWEVSGRAINQNYSRRKRVFFSETMNH